MFSSMANAFASKGGNWIDNAVGGFISGTINEHFSERAEDRAFSKARWMASNAHQLEVADLRAAGLNPILSATGGSGATFPSVPMGSTNISANHSANSLIPLQKEQIQAQIDATRAQSAESLARATETRKRTEFEYGKEGSLNILGSDGQPLGSSYSVPGSRFRELEAQLSLMEEQRKKLGFSNIEDAAKSGVYQKWPLLPEVEKALELGSGALEIANPLRKLMSPLPTSNAKPARGKGRK